MVDLTADKRKTMPQSQFALPGKRFPMNDPTHQRLAISGATRSERAGNISASTADRIKSEARAKLGGPKDASHPRMHALSIAAATHLHNAGHLPDAQAARIKAKAKAGMKAAKSAQPFGSLAPEVDQGWK